MRVGPKRQQILEGSSGDEDIAINADAVVYSRVFDLSMATNHAFECIAAGTTVKLKIELEQGNVLPATDGAADTTNYSVPSGASDIVSSHATKTHFSVSHSPVTSKYGRLKITGLAGGSDNTADVYINAWWVKLEDV